MHRGTGKGRGRGAHSSVEGAAGQGEGHMGRALFTLPPGCQQAMGLVPTLQPRPCALGCKASVQRCPLTFSCSSWSLLWHPQKEGEQRSTSTSLMPVYCPPRSNPSFQPLDCRGWVAERCCSMYQGGSRSWEKGECGLPLLHGSLRGRLQSVCALFTKQMTMVT